MRIERLNAEAPTLTYGKLAPGEAFHLVTSGVPGITLWVKTADHQRALDLADGLHGTVRDTDVVVRANAKVVVE